MMLLLAGVTCVALGASTIAHAQGAPPIPPGNIPGVPKEAPKASPVIPDSVVGAPREQRLPNPSRSPSSRGRSRLHDRSPTACRHRTDSSQRQSRCRSRRRAVGGRRRPEPTLPSAVTAPVEPPRVERTRGCAYGAFQRGQYLTAFTIATQRVEQQRRRQGDGAARRALCHRPGREAGRHKAAEWYRLAADRGDRDAMFALAMLRMAGRAGPVNREEAAKLLAAAARLEHPMASYNLAHALSRRPAVPAGFRARRRTVPRGRGSRQPGGAIRACHPLQGGPRREGGHRRGDAAALSAAIADNPDAQVEYAIALFNGSGVAKNEEGAARFLRAARTAAARSRRTGWPMSWRPGAACPPIRSRRSSGT